MYEKPEKIKNIESEKKLSAAKILEESRKEVFEKPKMTWSSVLNRFKKALNYFKGSKSEKDLLEKQKEEIETMEMLSERDGVNFSRCQMDRIVAAYKAGKRVEFESFSPYLSDYNMATGEIWEDNLTKSDKIGTAIGKMLRENFSKARLISLYDEYNSEMPDSADATGRPISEGSQIIFPEETKNNFKKSLKEVMHHKGMIREGDQEGKDFLFVSESSKIKDAEQLVAKLEEKGKIKRDGQAIYFINPDAENQEYQEIILRTKNGRWLCEALDASSYIKEENLEITHLVVLPNHFKKQQDKVWEMLRVLGIEPTNYHNIFYDENADPKRATEIINEEIKKYL